MGTVLAKHPETVNRALKAMELVGLKPVRQCIRGGTDGPELSFMGVAPVLIFLPGACFPQQAGMGFGAGYGEGHGGDREDRGSVGGGVRPIIV